MAEKLQHELRKLDEAKEKDLTRSELEDNIPRYKDINHNQASRDSIKFWIFPERSISHSLALFGLIPQNNTESKTGAGRHEGRLGCCLGAGQGGRVLHRCTPWFEFIVRKPLDESSRRCWEMMGPNGFSLKKMGRTLLRVEVSQL